ncbi:MAG: glycosyltransferase family 4 protein [Magnetococcus sp. YQC-5]
MRIALVLMQYKPFGGYERQARVLAETLLGKGHELTIISSRWSGDEHSGFHFYKIPLLRGASWLKVASYALSTRWIVPRIAHRFDRIIAFDRSLGMDIYWANSACHRAWLHLRRQHQGFKDRFSIAINPLHPIINRIEKAIFQRMEHQKGTIVVLSRQGIEQIRSHYPVAPQRFQVIPPVVDFSRFQGQCSPEFRRTQRASLGLGERDRLLLHVGSGFRIKGVERMIRALPFLSETAGQIRLIVVGADKRGIRRGQALANQLNLQQRVVFVGGVEDVGGYYAAADVLLLLSLLETFGAVAMEAFWFGLPVILGAGVGAAEHVVGEHMGSIVAPETGPEKLAEVIMATLEREQKAHETGKLVDWQHQRRQVAMHCHPDQVMGRYLELILNDHDKPCLANHQPSAF